MKEIELLKTIFKDSPDILEPLNEVDKEIERLIEVVKKWQDIATKLNNENNNLNSIIREAIELLNYVGWTHYADDEEYLYTLDINFYNKMLKILRGEE